MSRISDGLVIDHLSPWSAPEIMDVLGLSDKASRVHLLLGESSVRMGKKDIILAENYTPTRLEEQKLGILAPRCTLNFLEDGRRARKCRPSLPDLLEQLIVCSNPKCITRAEEVPHKILMTHQNSLPFQCHYCQSRFSRRELRFA